MTHLNAVILNDLINQPHPATLTPVDLVRLFPEKANPECLPVWLGAVTEALAPLSSENAWRVFLRSLKTVCAAKGLALFEKQPSHGNNKVKKLADFTRYRLTSFVDKALPHFMPLEAKRVYSSAELKGDAVLITRRTRLYTKGVPSKLYSDDFRSRVLYAKPEKPGFSLPGSISYSFSSSFLGVATVGVAYNTSSFFYLWYNVLIPVQPSTLKLYNKDVPSLVMSLWEGSCRKYRFWSSPIPTDF